jgi:uncharacterized membrane protein
VACLFLAGYALRGPSNPDRPFLVIGGLLYDLGTVGVTMVCNVPRNNALASMRAASDEGARVWADYLITWTRWNHVRTVTALAASATLTFALLN